MAGTAYAEELVVDIHLVSDSGVGEKIGTVIVRDTQYGALFTPLLDRFPLALVFLPLGKEAIRAGAFAHVKRRPRYWLGRVTE